MLIERPKSAVLCPQCTNILPLLVDISSTPKLGNAHTEWWDATYGKIQSIQGLVPNKCELCRMVYNAFVRVPGFNAADTKIRISNRTFVQYKGLAHSSCSFEACGAQLSLAPILPVVTTDDGEKVLAFTARPVLQLMNPLLARNWISKCEKEHTACKPDYSSKDFDFPFRLIDVVDGRIVEATPGARYVSLSYVWGGVKQVMLNRTTQNFLEQKGSIGTEGLREPEEPYLHVGEAVKAEGRVIPRTIRDAIRLCQLINERYFWTDSLCIMQDDDFQGSTGAWTNADKMAQIPKMDIIYGASVLTIIGACGADSNAGLPGIHFSNARARQAGGKIGDQFFLSVSNDPMDSFWQSTWCQRAWTFQEFLLSKRHLIFLPEQTVFHCSTTSWCEDHSLEHVDDIHAYTNAVPVWTVSYKLRHLQLPDPSNWSDSVFFPAIHINDYYNNWLKNFLKRRLTVSSDILFAFDGALSASRRHLGTFHHGLPVDYFCESLNWLVGQSSMYIGSGKDPHKGLTQRRSGFPSWSWTGWIWDVASFEEFHINYQGKTQKHWGRVAVWATRTSSDGSVDLWEITSPDMKEWDRLEFFPSLAFQVTDDFIERELASYLEVINKFPIPLNCLVVKTLTSSVYVSSERQSYNNSLLTYSSPEFIPENLVGAIKFPLKWQNQIGEGLRLQVVIIGTFFYGPSPRFPDQTDEMDPSIVCVVVEQVADARFERLTNFVERFSLMKKLEWSPIVAILQ